MSGKCVEVSFTRNCREYTRISCKPFWYMVSCPCRATDKAKPQTELRTYDIITKKRRKREDCEMKKSMSLALIFISGFLLYFILSSLYHYLA